jgi:hypothetical protein
VVLAAGTPLPAGAYLFMEMFCTEPDCDCRKVMMWVEHDGRYVALINYGWEDEAFYAKWMGVDQLADMDRSELMGPALDINSPIVAGYDDILSFFREIMNDTWRNSIIANYQRFRLALANHN